MAFSRLPRELLGIAVVPVNSGLEMQSSYGAKKPFLEVVWAQSTYSTCHILLSNSIGGEVYDAT